MGNLIRSRARAVAGDVVWAGFAGVVVLASAWAAISLPEELTTIPLEDRAQALGPLLPALAVSVGVLSAVYASFRFTIDAREGVLSWEATRQPRVAVILSRLVAAVLGGAALALLGVAVLFVAVVVRWHVVLEISAPLAVTIAAAGALCATWGFAIGTLVRAHLFALFVVPFTLGVSVPIVAWEPATAPWLPLTAMLGAAGVDLTAVLGEDAPAQAVCAVTGAGWLLGSLVVSMAVFVRRDLP